MGWEVVRLSQHEIEKDSSNFINRIVLTVRGAQKSSFLDRRKQRSDHSP